MTKQKIKLQKAVEEEPEKAMGQGWLQMRKPITYHAKNVSSWDHLVLVTTYATYLDQQFELILFEKVGEQMAEDVKRKKNFVEKE